jgi:inhibitor of KinA
LEINAKTGGLTPRSPGVNDLSHMTTAHTVPLGDQAALVYFNEEAAALDFAAGVRRADWPWLVDVVQAYGSVGVYFDLTKIDFADVAGILHQHTAVPQGAPPLAGKLHLIPCCYELALDLERVAEHTTLSPAEVIRLHSETVYTVYAIGFCPGFPYLGYLPAALSQVPRLTTPRVQVEAGSVGLTGRQTGIYTEPRPGGWNLVGRTPLQLVDVAAGYFPLRTGDRVCFERIDRGMFDKLRGQRL